jgi:hypothetical protein
MKKKIYAGAVAEIQEELERLEGLEKYFDGLAKISFMGDDDTDQVIEISRSTISDIHTQLDCAIDGIHYHLDPEAEKPAAPEGGAA